MRHSLQSRLYLGIAIFIALLSLGMIWLRYHNLHTNIWDFGIFDHYIHLFAEENNWYWFLKNHFSPILFLYGFLYKILSSPYLLLLTQWLSVCLGGYFLFKFARIFLDLQTSTFFLALFALHPMIHYQLFWDFHPDHIAIPVIIGIYLLVYSIQTPNITQKALLISLGFLLCLIKESMIPSAAFIGLSLLFFRQWRIQGIMIILIAILLWWISSTYVGYNMYKYHTAYITSFKFAEPSVFPSMYHKWGKSFSEMFLHLLQAPWEVILHLWEDKQRLLYIIVAFIPLLFLSLLSPIIMLAAIPPLAMSLLSSSPERYSIYHHYSASLIPVVFLSALFAFSKIRKNWQQRLIPIMMSASILLSIAFSPFPWGRPFYWTDAYNYGYDKLTDYTRATKIRTLIQSHIPNDYNLIICLQNNMYNAYIGHRRILQTFPNWNHQTDYIILDTNRVNDVGTVTNEKRYRNMIARLDNQFTLIFEWDGFRVYKRKK